MSYPSARMRRLVQNVLPELAGAVGIWADQIDRRTPLSVPSIVAIDDLLADARRIVSREPRADMLRPFADARPVMPADAFLRLVQAEYLLDDFVTRYATVTEDGEIVWEDEPAA